MAPESAADNAADFSAGRSVASPLAVSVSGLSFQSRPPTTGGRQVPTFAGMTTGTSPHHETSRMPSAEAATPASHRELADDYRGKCLYQSRKCENERALKRNGKAHNLCDEHRTKQNQHQRKFDAKKFSRKRRGDSDEDDGNGAGKRESEGDTSDHNDHNDPDASGERAEESEPVARPTRKRKGPPRDNASSDVPVVAAPLPQLKIRRFDGAKVARQRQSGGKAIKSEAAVATNAPSASLEGLSRLLQPPYSDVEQHATAATLSHDQTHRFKEDDDVSHLRSRVSTPTLYHSQYPEHQQSSRELAESPGVVNFRPAPGPPGGFPGPPLSAPLLPLAAIIGPSAGSRFSPPHHVHESVPRHSGFSPLEQWRRYVHVDVRTADVAERRSTLAERQEPFSPHQHHHQQQYQNQQFQHQHQHFQQRQHEYQLHHQPQYIPPQQIESGRHPMPPAYARYPARETHAASANRSVMQPRYSSAELAAAGILAPRVAPLASSVDRRSSRPRPQHPHTSVSPRGVPAMHPTAYAISPHHTRLQTPPGYVLADKQEYYSRHAHAPLRGDEQEEKQSASGGDWHRTHSQYATSPPRGGAARMRPPPPGPPRTLPPLAASAVQRALPSSSRVGSHRGLPPPPHSQQHQGPHLSVPPPSYHHHERHHHPQQPPSYAPTPATSMLPSLAPLRPRNPSSDPPSRHFSTSI